MSTPISLDVSAVVTAYRAGRPLRDIAADNNCSHVHIWRLLKRAGELVPKQKAPKTQAREELQKRIVIGMTALGMSLEDIAKAFGRKRDWAARLMPTAEELEVPNV